MQRITSPHVAEPQPETWSNCKVHGDFFQIAGCVSGYDNDRIAGGDDVYEQARLTFTKINHLVEAAGAGRVGPTSASTAWAMRARSDPAAAGWPQPQSATAERAACTSRHSAGLRRGVAMVSMGSHSFRLMASR